MMILLLANRFPLKATPADIFVNPTCDSDSGEGSCGGLGGRVLPEAVDTISLDETLGKQASFGLWAEGQSIHPTIQHGDLVLVQQGRLPRNRDIVVVRNERGEATLKQYICLKDRILLKPDNPDYGEPLRRWGLWSAWWWGWYDILWVWGGGW